ncbi:MAG: iron-sulfur cluster assembly scaffold protein [Christensenellaceae bacterium]|jgi:nitrogen fixation NifU-like protein|nr:iron-sulfur cluster assembly scaffold protein [Christensenellaceae bacterium]
MYNEKVLKIFENPKNAGLLKGANGVGKVGNMQCGDVMKVYVLVEHDKIKDAKFKTFGCVSAIASSDVACEMIKGKHLDDALKVTNKDVMEALGGLPPQKVHCSVLAQEAIEAAITDYKKSTEKKKK